MVTLTRRGTLGKTITYITVLIASELMDAAIAAT